MALRVSRLRRFHCLSCHHPMEAGEAQALSKLSCPSCGKPQTVPARLFDLVLQRRTGSIVAGEIFRGVEESSGRDVDILVMENDAGDRAAMVNATVRLHKTLAKLDHPYIQRIHRFMASDEHPIIVTEPRAESIASLMGKRGVHPVKLLHLAIQAARGFRAAESAGLCHMSLQPAFFQLRADFTVRVMGFSLWNHLFSAQPSNGWASCAPAAFLAPEVARGDRPDVHSDIYSFGACLLYFLTRQEATEQQSAREILRLEQDVIPSDLAEVLSALLMVKPSDRPDNWNEVVALLKGESTIAGSRTALVMEKKDEDDEDPRERSAPVFQRVGGGDEIHSGFLNGMMTANVEFDADDVLGQLHGMTDSGDAADFASEQMANAKAESPVDIMARAVMDGELSGDFTPEDLGSGLLGDAETLALEDSIEKSGIDENVDADMQGKPA